jgi:hypothetical protein
MPHLPFVAGDIVSVTAKDGTFQILKILAVDEGGLYTQIFSQKFTNRPRLVNIDELTPPIWGPVTLPVTHDQLALCQPEVIGYHKVLDEDLKDYRIWRSENGRYS